MKNLVAAAVLTLSCGGGVTPLAPVYDDQVGDPQPGLVSPDPVVRPSLEYPEGRLIPSVRRMIPVPLLPWPCGDGAIFPCPNPGQPIDDGGLVFDADAGPDHGRPEDPGSQGRGHCDHGRGHGYGHDHHGDDCDGGGDEG